MMENRSNSLTRAIELLGYRLRAVERALADASVGAPGTEHEGIVDHTMMEIDATIGTLDDIGAHLRKVPGFNDWVDGPMVRAQS